MPCARLGRQGLDPPGMLSKVEAQALKAKPYAPDNPDIVAEPVPGMSIVVGRGPWLAALAQYGRTRMLPDGDVTVLREHVADPSLRDLIVPALVLQEQTVAQSQLESSWGRRLAVLSRDSRGRNIEQAIIVGELVRRPWSEFENLLNQLREARTNSEEPELRMALGSIIIEAQIARCHATPRGAQLFRG
jgi:hypothetical protein